MKVLHLVGGSIESGAGKGALWLHLAQLEVGINSTLITNSEVGDKYKSLNVFNVCSKLGGYILKFNKRVLNFLPLKFYRARKKVIFSSGFDGVNFLKLDCYKDADIIHLHWINGLVSTRVLKKINKPIVWTLRDMWPFTGGCHISMGCSKYENSCGSCPQLGSKLNYDFSHLIYKSKLTCYPSDIVIVGISNWISNCAKESSIFRANRIETISNNVNTDLFYPIDKNIARKKLKLGKTYRIILLGAEVVGEPWKGFIHFVESLKFLDKTNLHFVFFGNVSHVEIEKLDISYSILGRIDSIKELSVIYSAADVFVAPSIYDSFGKTIVEALACKTLVVCFDATGPKDIVEHKKNGYKALPYCSRDLSNGINWVLNLKPSQYSELAEYSRNRAIRLFDSKIIASKYKQLYSEILTNA